MNWRPHTERPDQVPQCCLLATYDDEEGNCYLMGDLYYWDGSRFCHENDDSAPSQEVFWWITEFEVLEGLPE